MRVVIDAAPNSETVARLLEQTARVVYGERGPMAIHAGQWAVLRYLSIAGRRARTVGGVANYLGVTHAPASRAIAALVRKQLATISVDKDDRRVRYVDLTSMGRRLLADDPIHRLTFAINALGPRSRLELGEILELICDQMSKAG